MQYALEAYPEAEARFYFQLHNSGCSNPNSLNFNNETTWCMQEAGRQDAIDMLNVGQERVHQTLHEWFQDQELQKEKTNLFEYIRDTLGY